MTKAKSPKRSSPPTSNGNSHHTHAEKEVDPIVATAVTTNDEKGPGSPTSSGKTSGNSHGNHHHHHHHSSGPTSASKEPVVLLADQSAQAKWANWSVRTLWTLIMIGGFFACVAAGPLFVILLVVVVQGLVYKEVIYLAAVPSREKKLPWFRAMNWYFLFSTNYFFYGESLIHYFQHVVFVDAFLLPFATHHRFISFTLYVIGFVFFVANLKKGHYRFQFSQFAWTHMTLLLVVCQSHFIINNIFEGLIWFFLPVSLVIANDIWAYIFGFFFGKTPLIKLSPKKTVEGFVGGWIMTIVFGILFSTLFLRYPYMICPVKDLRSTAFSGLTCEPNPVFIPVKHYLKPWMVALVRHLGMRSNYVMIAPLQLHTIVMACFASLIAPFGGFFASGFKRAFKIKDFGQSIPGHGGITDRMDCQFLMGLFSYMYYQSFIKTSAVTVGFVLQNAINLKAQEQMELFDHLRQYLIGQGLLDEDSCVIMPPKEAWVS
ncbi:cytidylyltransferase family-domain-containing protein [Lobosporangium transversale]|uniref:Phosphatidate cytidylyltransferase n=1 Tax=Lobosporangium transversale TaxID=64571 RepID=A0A1Y2GC08_9FUNG|nr:cytidylyltransferase family-domain-containing protein [Lobosporangium transversale]ORZ05308.1 cytidylyltransferase family-domain-containing protein [Lobosporangium transversale]|eukprot:XP_021877000.1 cytidylyltransferase family-domain-containing protein [Lobosporangium transversale]